MHEPLGSRGLAPLKRIRKHNWSVGVAAGVLALVALVVGSDLGKVQGTGLDPKVIEWSSAGVLLVSGVIASSRLSAALSHLVVERGAPAAAGMVRVLSAGVGYLFVLFSVLAVLEVSVVKLLVGAGLASVVLGLAAQQSLSNVFAGLVLLIARPFRVGDHIRVRAGSLGGIFDAWVWEMSLTYVTLHTDDGLLKVPNSAMLAAGIGQLPMDNPPGAPSPDGLAGVQPATNGDVGAGAEPAGPSASAPRKRRRRPRSRAGSPTGPASEVADDAQGQ